MQLLHIIFQMTSPLTVLLIIVAIHLSCGLSSDGHHRSKHPRYEFILHKCTASVELNRKHRTEEAPNDNMNTPENLTDKVYKSTAMTEKNSTSPGVLPTPDNTQSYSNFETSNATSTERRFTKNVRNIPLRTLNIKSMQSLLPMFTKKYLLPELEGSTNKTRQSPQNVVVIKAAV